MAGARQPVVPSDAGRDSHIVEVNSLTLDYATIDSTVRVLEGVSMRIGKGEIVGVVGESGSGKTTLGLAIIGLHDSPPARIVAGSVLFEGRDVTKMSRSELEDIRGRGIGMVFQESLASLNPVYRTESQMKESLEVLRRAGVLEGADERRMMIDMLTALHIDRPELVLQKYPHELSGGMRQRVAIAMAIMERPKLLILDEVTTGLDVYVQNMMLNMLRELNRKMGVTMMLITHDLAVASQICDRLYVMYAGRVMELGNAPEVLGSPLHPYTKTLLASIPQGFEDSPPLPVSQGDAPDLRTLPTGCKFHPRCPYVMQVCVDSEPALIEVSPGRYASCWLHAKGHEQRS